MVRGGLLFFLFLIVTCTTGRFIVGMGGELVAMVGTILGGFYKGFIVARTSAGFYEHDFLNGTDVLFVSSKSLVTVVDTVCENGEVVDAVPVVEEVIANRLWHSFAFTAPYFVLASPLSSRMCRTMVRGSTRLRWGTRLR